MEKNDKQLGVVLGQAIHRFVAESPNNSLGLKTVKRLLMNQW